MMIVMNAFFYVMFYIQHAHYGMYDGYLQPKPEVNHFVKCASTVVSRYYNSNNNNVEGPSCNVRYQKSRSFFVRTTNTFCGVIATRTSIMMLLTNPSAKPNPFQSQWMKGVIKLYPLFAFPLPLIDGNRIHLMVGFLRRRVTENFWWEFFKDTKDCGWNKSLLPFPVFDLILL